MRNLLVVMIATLILSLSVASPVRAQNSNLREQSKQLKLQQKRERNALKIQQKNIKASWNKQPVSKAIRLQSKHQMERDWRSMRERQKDARQDLADHQRTLRDRQRLDHS
jgi:hypothetical protein